MFSCFFSFSYFENNRNDYGKDFFPASSHSTPKGGCRPTILYRMAPPFVNFQKAQKRTHAFVHIARILQEKLKNRSVLCGFAVLPIPFCGIGSYRIRRGGKALKPLTEFRSRSPSRAAPEPPHKPREPPWRCCSGCRIRGSVPA